MAIFIEGNKKVKNIFANVNGDKKSISSAWVNRDGVPTKVFQLDNSEQETDPYEVAPEDAYSDWNYTLDNTNNIIILNYYIGSKTDVIVYGNYIVNKKIYKTQLLNRLLNTVYSNYMFKKTNVISIKFSNDLDTSNITSFSGMFEQCFQLEQISFGKNFNTSNATSMNGMFYYCTNLTNIDLNNFDTHNITDMSGMFYHCESLTNLDLSHFDTQNVTSMRTMFCGCSKLKTIYVSENKWIISNVNDVYNMFKNCGTSSVTYI